ncbi:MAG: hypothetical protein RBS07_12215 [Lentimicrobium sp.]|jgi:hypothetical protein|nr:hypothetical protein [Lentimicrobium sp.]
MRIPFLFLLLLFSSFQTVEAQVTLSQARSNYLSIATDECKALELSKMFEKKQPSDALLKAYYGASSAAAPACLSNPMDKLKYFRKGKDLLDESVKQQPAQVEIRFLRFATQTKAPSFLGYNDNLEEDKRIILKHFAAYARTDGNAMMSKHIARFMIVSGQLSNSEKSTLNSVEK